MVKHHSATRSTGPSRESIEWELSSITTATLATMIAMTMMSKILPARESDRKMTLRSFIRQTAVRRLTPAGFAYAVARCAAAGSSNRSSICPPSVRILVRTP